MSTSGKVHVVWEKSYNCLLTIRTSCTILEYSWKKNFQLLMHWKSCARVKTVVKDDIVKKAFFGTVFLCLDCIKFKDNSIILRLFSNWYLTWSILTQLYFCVFCYRRYFPAVSITLQLLVIFGKCKKMFGNASTGFSPFVYNGNFFEGKHWIFFWCPPACFPFFIQQKVQKMSWCPTFDLRISPLEYPLLLPTYHACLFDGVCIFYFLSKTQIKTLMILQLIPRLSTSFKKWLQKLEVLL